jgi:hypothetical protein
VNRVPLLLPPHEREHPTYARLRDGTDPASEERRAFFDALWAEYVPFAPKDYPKKLRIEFHPRWWEMYLTVALVRLGFAVQPNPADVFPDVHLVVDGAQVFVEAVAPTAGTRSDRVPDPVHQGVIAFPERECLLRLTQALTDKAGDLRKNLSDGVIPGDACRIIALSASDLNQIGSMLDGTHPAPLSVLAGAGPLELTIGGTAPPRSSRREFLTRDAGSPVPATLFDAPEFSIVSGVVYSSVDLWNAPLDARTTLSLFVNPMASVPVPARFEEGFATWKLEADRGDAHVWTRRA